MNNTAEKILAFLEKRNLASIAEISTYLQLSRADIRYQMKGLIGMGKIRTASIEKSSCAGRPRATFEIIRPVPSLLIRKMIQGYSSQLAAFGVTEKEMKHKLAAFLLADLHLEGPAAVRLNQAIAYLSEIGITAAWEAGSTGPMITIRKNEFLDDELIQALENRIHDLVNL